MTAETVARTISLILAPVVMLTACSLVINGLLQRYEAISGRMRSMNGERLSLLRSTEGHLRLPSADDDPFTAERVHQIDTQLPRLLRRHRLIHNAVLTVYSAIAIFVASMFVIAAAALTNSDAAAVAALGLFLLGTAVLLLGVLITTDEIRTSQREITYEVQRVLDLGE